MLRWFAPLLLVLLGGAALRAQEGKLQQVREQIAPPKDEKKDDKDKKKKPTENDAEDGLLGALFGELLGAVILAPYVIPHECLEGAGSFDRFFLPYPYAE